MSVFAALLVAVGVADLVRSALVRDPTDRTKGGRRPSSRGRLAPATLAGMAMLAVTVGVAGLAATTSGALLCVLAAASAIAWLVLSDRALRSRSGHVLALVALVGGLVAQLALSGFALPADGWLGDWLRWARLPWRTAPDAERVLLVAGLALLQLSTGNVVVRLVLTSIGAMKPEGERTASPSGTPLLRPQPSDELKGGRLLGPLERVFILGLGLAGQYTAAGMVIAAKGLIRWPELKAKSETDPRGSSTRTSGIDAVTEYFLVGSFTSWLVALASLALAR